MQSKAGTVEEYLAELPVERRAVLEKVRRVIVDNLDADFEEGMQYGMIGYFVPHRIYPPGYHCDPRQPLPFAGLAAQKNHYSMYLLGLYSDAEWQTRFANAWGKSGKKLDMGKCCIRFKRPEDLALDVIADFVRGAPAAEFIRRYEAAISSRTRSPSPKGKSSKKKPSAPAAAKAKGKKAPRKTTKR